MSKVELTLKLNKTEYTSHRNTKVSTHLSWVTSLFQSPLEVCRTILSPTELNLLSSPVGSPRITNIMSSPYDWIPFCFSFHLLCISEVGQSTIHVGQVHQNRCILSIKLSCFFQKTHLEDVEVFKTFWWQKWLKHCLIYLSCTSTMRIGRLLTACEMWHQR